MTVAGRSITPLKDPTGIGSQEDLLFLQQP